MEYDYIIWHDNDFDLAQWIWKNTILCQKKVQFRRLPRTNNPSHIIDNFSDEGTKIVMKYIKYETPDIIIQKMNADEGYPIVCVTEFMTHTPQWQHPAQRFARLYTSSILRTPTALIIPQQKVKWEKGTRTIYKKTMYSCSPSVYQLFVDTTNKNNTPTLIFNWPDKEGYLLYDENHQTSPMIQDDIIKWFEFVNTCIEKDGVLEVEDYSTILTQMMNKAEITSPTDFDTIRNICDTSAVICEFNLDKTKLSSSFLSNDKTLVFAPNGLKCSSSKFRTDPYAGILCAFDVMFCRNEQFEKNINLLFIAKNVKKSEIVFSDDIHDTNQCPFIHTNVELSNEHLTSCYFTQAKYRRIYGDIADVIIFDDTIFYNRGEE